MFRPSMAVALGTLAGLACASSQRVKPSPWTVPATDFANTVKIIGIGPMVTPDDLRNPDPVRALFDSLITKQLTGLGYQIERIPEAIDVAMEETNEHGAYDPVTGRPDSVRMRTATEHAAQRLAEKHPSVGAFMRADVVIVPATIEGTSAFWDGTSQSFASFGDFLAMREYQGSMPAYSLCVRFWSPTGAGMYHNHGGIELAANPKGEIERTKLFDTPERNNRAVLTALESLPRHQ